MLISRFLIKSVTSPLTCKLCHHAFRLSVPNAYLPSLVQMSTRNNDSSSSFSQLAIVSKAKQSSNGRAGGKNPPLLAAGFISGLLSLLGWEDLLSKEDPFILTIKRGILCMQREEFDKAEIILHAALSNAVDMGHNKAIVYIYSLMGNVAFLKGDYEKSEKIYKDLIKRLLEQGIEEDHEAMVEISLKLATIYSKLGKFSKADVGFSHCLNIQKKRANQIEIDKKYNELSEADINSLALYGMALDFYGKHLLRKQDYEGALKYTLDALAVCEKVNGVHAHQTMILLSDVGTLLNLTNNFDKADEYFKKAIKIGTVIDSDHLKTLYYNVGMNDVMRRNWLSAKQNCDASYRIAKKDDDTLIMNMAEDCLKKIRAQAVQ